eukprot:SAG25_NODE_2974_length_1286_cov_1.082561_1_plen_52_part_10
MHLQKQLAIGTMVIGFVGAQQIYHAADTTKVRQLMTAAAPSCLTCTSLSELS